MAIQILSNLNYPIGNIINQELQNANSAKMAVAFLKYSGKVIGEVIGFLNEMKAEGSPKLKHAVDVVIRGLRDGSLLTGLGVKVGEN